jgi:hypothetical protein
VVELVKVGVLKVNAAVDDDDLVLLGVNVEEDTDEWLLVDESGEKNESVEDLKLPKEEKLKVAEAELDPTGPSQVSPMGQHPYMPSVASQHTSEAGQPPSKSGQQVSVIGMQPIPQSFSSESQKFASAVIDASAAALVDDAIPVVAVTKNEEEPGPTGPSQVSPRGQHPYIPSVPNQQTSEAGHPPCRSGQQVSVSGIQPSPHSVSSKSQKFESAVDVAPAAVTVDDWAPADVTVAVKNEEETPPGPSQVSPMGQHPYSSFVPSQQISVIGQPPCWSGQQVSVSGMQ